MRRLVWYWLPPLAWMALVFATSAQPQLPEVGGPESPWDAVAHKAAHVVVYAVLAGLYYRLLGQFRLLPDDRSWLAACLTILYGLSDELHQLLVPGRSGRLADVGVDAVGVALAMLAWTALERRRLRLPRRAGAR